MAGDRLPPDTSRYSPVLDLQPVHPLKFPGIVGYQDQPARFRLPGDQDIIAADRRILSRQIGPDLTGDSRILAVEVDDGQISEEQSQRLELAPLSSGHPGITMEA